MLPVNVLPTETLSVVARVAEKLVSGDSSARTISKQSRVLQTQLSDAFGRLLPAVLILFKSLGYVETCDSYVCDNFDADAAVNVLTSLQTELARRNSAWSSKKPVETNLNKTVKREEHQRELLNEQLAAVRAQRHEQFMRSTR